MCRALSNVRSMWWQLLRKEQLLLATPNKKTEAEKREGRGIICDRHNPKIKHVMILTCV